MSLENMASSRVWRRASIQRVVPREETLSHLIPNVYSIVIAPIYRLLLNFVFGYRWENIDVVFEQ